MPEDLTQVPVPDLEHPLFAPHWAATAEGRIVVQHCEACGRHQWPPRTLCIACGGDAGWTEVPQTGTLYSWTVVGHRTARGYGEVPYAVGIVELDGDVPVRMIGGLRGIELSALKVGLPLRARFVKAGPEGEMTLVQWEPDPGR